MEEVESEEGYLEYDFLLNNWDLMEITRPVSFSRITHNDIQRPDIISYRIYGTIKYWWILCKINNIGDLWNDIKVGDIIAVPSVSDINEFYDKVSRRKRR